MAAISEEEKILITQFRENIKDLNLSKNLNDERLLIRWIRGRDHNLAQAEDMLRNSMKWRTDNDIDNIRLWKAPKNLQREYPMLISGLDKEGCPVGYVRFGVWDVKRLIGTGQRETFLKYVDQLFDGLLGTPHPNGNTQMVLVVDLERYSFRQVTAYGVVEALMEAVRRFDQNYPECLKYAVLLNASKVFMILFAILKPILPARTLAKIEMLNSDAIKWKARLQETIPLEELPTSLGGTNALVEKILYGNEPVDADIPTTYSC